MTWRTLGMGSTTPSEGPPSDSAPGLPHTLPTVAYTWTCSRCSQVHEGLPLSWAFDAPIYWHWLGEAKRRTRGFCDGDFCFMTDAAGEPARFVRGTIEIPIVDAADPAEDSFVIGVWASLSERSFDEVGRAQQADGADAGPWFGWLSNRIPVYPDTLNLQTQVRHRQGLRPLVEIKPSDHPLAQDASGITVARARELAERWYHESDAR